jgi:hypothetical protein
MRLRARVSYVALALAVLVPGSGLAAAAPEQGSAQQVGCAWPARINEDTLNFWFPDTFADYWAAHFPFVEGARLVIEGHYPFARYFSFHAYDELQRPVDGLADFEIRPEAGSANPFRAGRAPRSLDDRRYTAFVEFTPPPERREPNTIYAGAMRDGNRNPGGFVVYRIYIPDDPDDDLAGVPLPDMTLETAQGNVEIPLGRCDQQVPPGAGGAVNDAFKQNGWLIDTGGDSMHPAATDPLTFKRFYGTDQFPRDFQEGNADDDRAEAQFEGGFLSNLHVAYLYAYVARGFDDVIVLRIKAPTFPDTRSGQRPMLPRQVRYWSVCQNNGLSQRVVDCTADFQAPVGPDGHATVVISDPDDRPANATRRDGVAWIPWGAYPEGLVIYRHMLPARSFQQAIQHIPQGEAASEHTGAYYPRGTYCSTEDFESGGWRACFGG